MKKAEPKILDFTGMIGIDEAQGRDRSYEALITKCFNTGELVIGQLNEKTDRFEEVK